MKKVNRKIYKLSPSHLARKVRRKHKKRRRIDDAPTYWPNDCAPEPPPLPRGKRFAVKFKGRKRVVRASDLQRLRRAGAIKERRE